MSSKKFEITVTGPRKTHLFLAIVGLAGCALGAINFFYSSKFEIQKDGLTFGVMSLLLIWFTYRFLYPRKIIIFSDKGIWTEKLGFVIWDDFGGVAIETRSGYKGAQDRTLLFLFEPTEKRGFEELSFKFSDLSISEESFKEMLQNELKGYMEL